MHQREGHQGQDPHQFPGPFLHLHGAVPPSGIQEPYGGIDMRGAELVLTYGFGEGRGAEEEDIQQFRASDQAPEELNQGQIRKNRKESGVIGRLLIPIFRKWERG